MEWINILWVVLGIGLMLVLNIRYQINSMIALLLAALLVGTLAGMDLLKLLHTIKAGFGGTLGELAIIVVFGAVIGKLMVDSGAAHQIAQTLLRRFGIKYVEVAVIIIGLIFGLAMFYEVAFIILAPLIIAIAVEAKIPFLKLAIRRLLRRPLLTPCSHLSQGQLHWSALTAQTWAWSTSTGFWLRSLPLFAQG